VEDGAVVVLDNASGEVRAWVGSSGDLSGAAPPTVQVSVRRRLEGLDLELNAAGISLVFAELKTPVRQKIEHYALSDTLDPSHFFETIREAVDAFSEETGTEWTEGPGPFTLQ